MLRYILYVCLQVWGMDHIHNQFWGLSFPGKYSLVGRGSENITHPCAASKKMKAKVIRSCLFPQPTQTFRYSNFREEGEEGENCLFGCIHFAISEKDFRSDIFFKWKWVIFFSVPLIMYVEESSTELSTKQQMEWVWIYDNQCVNVPLLLGEERLTAGVPKWVDGWALDKSKQE